MWNHFLKILKFLPVFKYQNLSNLETFKTFISFQMLKLYHYLELEEAFDSRNWSVFKSRKFIFYQNINLNLVLISETFSDFKVPKVSMVYYPQIFTVLDLVKFWWYFIREVFTSEIFACLHYRKNCKGLELPKVLKKQLWFFLPFYSF